MIRTGGGFLGKLSVLYKVVIKVEAEAARKRDIRRSAAFGG